MVRRAAAALALLLLVALPALAQRMDGIAAVVNDDVVLESDVEEQLALFLMRSQVQPPDSATVDTLREQILNQLIDEKLIFAEARRQGITATEAEVVRQVGQAIAEAKERMGGEENFQRQLQRENLTEEKLREKYKGELERQMIAQRLVTKVLPKKTVTADEARAYFQANRDKFPRVPPEVRLQVIQIPATADSATDAKAKARALAARKRLVAGEKFAKVAAEVSEDPSSARSGGDLGFIARGQTEPAVEQAAFSLAIGKWSEPVRSAYGWHIVEAMERDTMKTRAGGDSLDKAGKPVIETHVRHILIRVPIEEADAERAKKLAERVRSEAGKGTDFGTLVRRYSKYEGQQTPDGDIGFVSLASLQPNIRAGLDTLETGAISDVLVNQIGFNIFKVVDRKPAREYELEEIKEDLPELVSQMKQRDRYDEWVKTLRNKAHIEIRRS
jgi:peptidyl-prolyl cis-trans isomerase SurA